jgi:hypothetical protein
MFSDVYELAETSVRKTGTPVNTTVGLACLVSPITNKFAFSCSNLQFMVYSIIIQTRSNFAGVNVSYFCGNKTAYFEMNKLLTH